MEDGITEEFLISASLILCIVGKAFLLFYITLSYECISFSVVSFSFSLCYFFSAPLNSPHVSFIQLLNFVLYHKFSQS